MGVSSSHRRRRTWGTAWRGLGALVVPATVALALGGTGRAPQPAAPSPPPRPTPRPDAGALVPAVSAAPVATPSTPPRPTARVSAPTPQPTPSPTNEALVAELRRALETQWVKNHAETPLRSGPDDAAAPFTTLPQWTTLRQLDSRPDWVLVAYAGDGLTRQAGPGWVRAADVGAIDTPPVWIASTRSAPLWSDADGGARRTLELPAAARMEVVGPDAIRGTRLHVRLPGDGRQLPPSQGWVDAANAQRIQAPEPGQLPWAYPAEIGAQTRIAVPYRTQLDGSDYAQANCGPTALGMALEAFGVDVPARQLRTAVLEAQDTESWDNQAGSFIWALAQVAQSEGLKPSGLLDADGAGLRHWTIEEIRQNLRQGRPVIVQVRYRALPRRAWSGYLQDHYVVLTGLLGDSFLYNDPIGGPRANEEPGWDRVMTAAELQRAMNASDREYAYSAFAVGR